MVKINMLRAITSPIKSIFSKSTAVDIANAKKKDEETLDIQIRNPKVKEVDCIFMMHEMLCLEIYEDGYIKRI